MKSSTVGAVKLEVVDKLTSNLLPKVTVSLNTWPPTTLYKSASAAILSVFKSTEPLLYWNEPSVEAVKFGPLS